MKRSERLEKINAINLGMENMAGVSLANIQAEYNTQLHQLDQLKVYGEDYSEQLRSRLASQITPQELQDYRFFFASIDKAISQQAQMVQHYVNLVDKSKSEWLQKHQEVRKLDIATQSLKKTEQTLRNRQEQKQSDELARLFFNPSEVLARH